MPRAARGAAAAANNSPTPPMNPAPIPSAIPGATAAAVPATATESVPGGMADPDDAGPCGTSVAGILIQSGCAAIHAVGSGSPVGTKMNGAVRSPDDPPRPGIPFSPQMSLYI